jgi:F0F1-type ATP synthase membrane subunit a
MNFQRRRKRLKSFVEISLRLVNGFFRKVIHATWGLFAPLAAKGRKCPSTFYSEVEMKM